MDVKKFTTEIEGKELSVELGSLAQLSNGSALVKFGQTVVLATVVMLKNPGEKKYLPLTVDYEERFYAAGKIKGSRWIKREGRPTDEAILTGRLVDRTIRPLFNSKIRNDIQVILTVLSFDGENDPAIPALIGASTAISISDIPWNGPVAGISIGQSGKDWIITPNLSAKANSGSEIFIAGVEKDKETLINMIEGQTPQIAENDILEGIEFSKKYIKNLLDFQKKIIGEVNPQKKDLKIEEIEEEFKKEIEKFLEDKLEKSIYVSAKKERLEGLGKLQEELIEFVKGNYQDDTKKINQACELFEEKIDKIIHENILKHNKRPDDRKLDELREITTAIGILPRTHGSGLFKRGDTQILSLVTLGSPGAEQYLDQMELEGKKSFMHDYNFPPYSVGDIGPMRGPGRREIGHGALAEKALLPIIPSKEEFPYTIRIVSEVLSSNGSSSMGSVCGSTLALLDAGIPIKANVSGIAMGLMSDGEKYRVLTDIQGPEDHHGDMDLKIAGTRNGVTALQMDVKINGVTIDILKDTFRQAKKARLEILDTMEKTIKKPRPELSPFAPRVYTLQINPSKIGLVIGPGGKTINEIVAETGAAIDIEDDGRVFVTSENAELAKKAIGKIKTLTREVKVGEIFQGKVVKITDFGAFIELYPKQDGLLHISELGHQIKNVEDVIREGDVIDVKVKKIDANGKVGLALEKKPKKI
ncbi:MAG: polyribonucleotide nucleotidyltransferase [Candidatus Portnoybacteria bacterium RBG_13_40_8]|uniref:Polyribonucleotide nucleotidyltransferase n=1 Tax=Candidatus Portnoybacteria bacterium RBG_13_40_8 TaxID=1801990 RepID=A0A1G2F3L4_9BACT|nr:MAG: polyribonucleotide nucleotidyltransferase [Candidatus Portnoybacteria bacterium RBG_13_40_8]OGZ34850.1 MAG: polyribonucleotide nucleotidyltransferase [Candidatus Portnoybacteria bacterium RIFCSPHIGHO2_01_FULL_39_19]